MASATTCETPGSDSSSAVSSALSRNGTLISPVWPSTISVVAKPIAESMNASRSMISAIDLLRIGSLRFSSSALPIRSSSSSPRASASRSMPLLKANSVICSKPRNSVISEALVVKVSRSVRSGQLAVSVLVPTPGSKGDESGIDRSADPEKTTSR